MGLPVGKLVCASNQNSVLYDFFKTGCYDRNRDFHVTKSPSMDILISSNLERLLALICGTEACAGYMKDLRETGKYTVTEEELTAIREVFAAGYADDTATYDTINRVYADYGYLMDTHTAVAWNVYEQTLMDSENKTVVLSTASAYKFAASVLNALEATFKDDFDALEKLHAFTGTKIPPSLENIREKEVVHNHTITKDEMPAFVMRFMTEKE
jgi:threonine synthase